jgi:hypothetical protein
VSPDLAEIVKADRAAARELDAAAGVLAARLQTERDRLASERTARQTESRLRADSEVSRLEADGHARVDAHRATRAAERDVHRVRAASAVQAAVDAYVTIVAGGQGGAS